MISSRYVRPVVLLLALALVPTVIHSYIRARVDDGRTTATIATTLEEMSSQPFTRHNAGWVMDMFNSGDWIERVYQVDSGHEIRLFVARSYDHKRLYHHPELGLSHGNDFTDGGVVMLAGKQEIPVHLLRGSNGPGIVAYALLYKGRFIRDPLKHQIQDSLKLLISPRRQMTMFYVADASVLPKQPFADTASAKLLMSAIDSFQAQKQVDSKP
jgi:hypothetical protein